MKQLYMAAAAALMMVSCAKEQAVRMPEGTGVRTPISFYVDGPAFDISTKVDAVTSLDAFNVMATYGTTGSESHTWTTVATKTGDTYVTGKYWPQSDLTYHFYASNSTMTFNAAGATVPADGSEDIVCAYSGSPTFNSSSPTALVFHHILARIGTLTVTSAFDYDIQDLTVEVTNLKTSGQYNLRTKSWSDVTTVASQVINEGNNDLYVLPGKYLIRASFTLVKGDYSGTFSGSGNVDIQVEKINNLSINIIKDPAVAINFSVSVAAWEPKTISLTLS
ncbi:MAG: fimbrillin family protein [Bacteroidales bacterium]|nr:fimbrillin family protein [Bacteroidales bacterium]